MTDQTVLEKVKNHTPSLVGMKRYKKFAVCIPLLETERGYELLFEVRSSAIDRQPGDICFPGGMLEKRENPETAALHKEKDRAISELRRLNDAIPDEKISAQIDHLEEVTGKIIDHVIADPAKQPQISRFLDYFLPTTIKLLNAYDRMDSAGVSGSNIDATKAKVEQMLNTLCSAFDKQLDALFSDEALDVSTDITVMENLLAQEGLSSPSAPTGGMDGPTLEL